MGATRSISARRVSQVGLAANLEKEATRDIVRELIPLLDANGVKIFLDPDLASAGISDDCDVGISGTCDAIVAVGGDGTILKIAARYLDHNIPLVGVKGGRLGFLTEATAAGVAEMLRSGHFAIQRRMRVKGTVQAGKTVSATISALNDIVIHSTGYSRMIGMRVEVGGKLLREFSADGLIVATPTGSTAYSLSAGGPVLEPTLEAILLTPLNPHTMSMRPMVLDATEVVRIHVTSSPSGVMVTVDGQAGVEMSPSQYIELRRDTRATRLIVPRDYDFFSLLREKL
ncbi:MAG TPA: NAD(+)/NADH kinase [Candidatus Krumholzibacteria bacterium]|nr:NAD(+)/NADH kinase [Candidatus Krumholzibacteria bacterium]